MAAIAPEVKAAAIADLMSGMSYERVRLKHSVGKATVVQWAKELREARHPVDVRPSERAPQGAADPSSDTPALSQEIRRRQFDEALDKFLGATIDMMIVWTEQCSDPEFIRDKPSAVHELGRTILERADFLVHSIRSNRKG